MEMQFIYDYKHELYNEMARSKPSNRFLLNKFFDNLIIIIIIIIVISIIIIIIIIIITSLAWPWYSSLQ